MPVNDYQLAELRHAYQVLGVPPDASAHSIKKTYRRLVKRWHPDLYPGGTPAQVEATHMTGLINEAYSAIAHAPLRDHMETYRNQTRERSRQTPSPSVNQRIWINNKQRFGPALLFSSLAVLHFLYFAAGHPFTPRRYSYVRLACYSLLALCGLIYALRGKPETLPPGTK
jgi:DnaJ-class molecular chaperone